MHSRKAPFFTRLGRLFRLAGWLFRTGKHLRRIDAGNPTERDHAVITLGKGALEALDIELEIGTPPADNVNGALVAANHVSWLDIFCHERGVSEQLYCQAGNQRLAGLG